MTKRLTAALLCVAASFAVGGVVTAQAQAKGLSYRTAKVLAKRLAQKQVQGRNVVSFHLTSARRVSPTRIVFAYDDRTGDHVFCTARLVVDQAVRGRITTISARFSGQRCNGIPSDVLAFEAITRTAQRDLRTNTAATVRALDALGASSMRCRNFTVPSSRRGDARALFDIALIEALEQPNDAMVGNFVASLLAVNASDATLSAGALGWADYLATVRSLPQVDDPCAALKRWKRTGYAIDQSPIDFGSYRRLNQRAAVDRRAIDRAAASMAAAGAFPNAALGFTPDGLLLQLSAKAGIAGGGAHKLILG
jgi:hypothetical protein